MMPFQNSVVLLLSKIARGTAVVGFTEHFGEVPGFPSDLQGWPRYWAWEYRTGPAAASASS